VESIKHEDKELLDAIAKGTELVAMSTLSEEGVQNVKQIACDKLLEHRAEDKLRTKKSTDVMNRLHVAVPAPRDQKVRAPIIPESVILAKEQQSSKMEEDKDLTVHGDEDERPFYLRGQNSLEWNKKYLLADDEWRFDNVPEIVNGRNIADFIDPEIMKRLEELEKEEEGRLNELENEIDDFEPLDEEVRGRVEKIWDKKKMAEVMGKDGAKDTLSIHKQRTASVSMMEESLTDLGLDPTKAVERARSNSRGRKRSRSASAVPTDVELPKKERRLLERSRSRSKTPAQEGFKSEKERMAAISMKIKSQKARNKDARKGDGDNVILNMMPKHLFAGKRGMGKTDRR